jgi:hypothetical protein
MIAGIPLGQRSRIRRQQQVFLEVKNEICLPLENAAKQAIWIHPYAKALRVRCDEYRNISKDFGGSGAIDLNVFAWLKLDEDLPASQIVRSERLQERME